MCYLHEVQQGQRVRQVLGHQEVPKTVQKASNIRVSFHSNLRNPLRVDSAVQIQCITVTLCSLTGGPGTPAIPEKPRCPFMPLSPASPASPLSPRGPAGPCMNRDENDQTGVELWINDTNEKFIPGNHEHQQNRQDQQIQQDPGRKWEKEKKEQCWTSTIIAWYNSA